MNFKNIKYKINRFILQIITFGMLDSLKDDENRNKEIVRTYIEKQKRRGVLMCASGNAGEYSSLWRTAYNDYLLNPLDYKNV